MLNDKLLETKVFKVNGVRFAIRKLSPSLFMDKDYLFPMTSCVEKLEKSGKAPSKRETNKAIEKFKPKMRDVIVKSVAYVKSNLLGKKQSINELIDSIMEVPELYSYLFTLIVNHSLGVKKNYSRLFKLTQTTQKLFT